MHLPLAAALAAPVLAALATQSEDAARLVPADATVLVRVASVQAWNELVRVFAPLAGDELAHYDLQAVLDGMAGEEVYAGAAERARLDPGRPLYLALTLDPAGQSFAFVAPVTNGQPLRLASALVGAGEQHLWLGSYAGISNRSDYALGAEPSARVAALRPGLVSVHVDLAALIASFRPLLEMGLRQAETSLDQMPSDAAPFDIQPLLELYIEMARGLMDAAESLDITLERDADELALRLDYVERTERLRAGEVTDVRPLLGHVDPASSLQLAFSGKFTDYLAFFESITRAALEMYPEPLRSDLARLLTQQRELEPLLAPGLALGFDLGAHGLRGCYVLRAHRPAELVAGLEGLLRTLDHEGGLVRIGALERLEVDGLEARVLPFSIQFARLWEVIQGAAAEEALEPEARRMFEETMNAIYGRELRLAFAHAGERVLVCLAHDDAQLRSDLARLRAPAAPSPHLLGLVERLEPGTLGFAYHLDLGRAMVQMLEAMRGILPGPIPSLPSMGFWGATGGRTWSGGMAVSLDELVGFARAVQALETK